MSPSTVPTDFDVKSFSSSNSDDNGISFDSIAKLPIVGKDTKDELSSVGMQCDVKNLWEGISKCTCCVNWVEEYPEDVTPNPEETGAVQRFALIVRHKKGHGSSLKAMVVHTIIVQSPLLKPLLEEVFEGYEGITATLKKVTFSKPFAPFFYRWSQFKKAVESQSDQLTRTHANLLYGVLSEELEETVNTYHDLLSHGVITYRFLWTLFRPGDLLLTQIDGEEMIVKLQSSDYESGGLMLYCKYVDWNGHYFGYASKDITISSFEGTKSITDLLAYPIRFNSECKTIESRLAARGKRFEEFQGYHYKMYRGFAQLMPTTFGNRPVPARSRTVDGRIIIHAEMYNRYNPHDSIPLEPLDSISFAPNLPTEIEPSHVSNPFMTPPPPPPPGGMYMPPPPPPPPPGYPGAVGLMPMHVQEPKLLSEEFYPICAPIIRGYSLKTKNWAKFKVDNVSDISWDDRAFESLVLPEGHKELILSFTKSQNATEDIVDDVIEGKGQGIVMLLTGEPGVGKTLTAESVAEHMHVPLYSMSAAQLGVNSASVEQALGDILEMVTKWKAILLIDECEVFLEQRSIDGLERNKLVSIFLRMLEYYRGVLFLTTNRVNRLDKAMESRIHLKIAYPELDRTARLQVWHNLIELLPSSSVGLDASEVEYLAEKKMNGREIKNVIKAARLLASGHNKALGLDHIHTVLRITQIGEDFGTQV